MKATFLLSSASAGMWRAFRDYLSAILVGNLIWETFHLPLYTIWYTERPARQVFAVMHCTIGDLLIAAFSLGLAILTIGNRNWPTVGFKRVAAAATVFGLGYTVFSEWLNTSVQNHWAYTSLMPTISLAGLQIGLSPLLQWLIVPPISFCYARWRQS